MVVLIKRALLFLIAAVGVACVHSNHWAGDKITLEFIGEATFPTGYQYAGAEVGGLSGIDYDPGNDRYVAISDDQGVHGPVRFFELTINLVDETLDPGDIVFTEITRMLDQGGEPLARLSVDPESIRFAPTGDGFAWSSEGTDSAGPFVRMMTTDGRYLDEFALSSRHLPNAESGIRKNKSFESLTFAADDRYLITAHENALLQDGPAATIHSGSPVRVLVLDTQSGATQAEYIYMTDVIADAPDPANAFATNGLVELLTLNGSWLLALERSYSTGVGNRSRLFLTTLDGASDVIDSDSIAGLNIRPMRKKLLFDLAELDLPLDNLEGMTFGPRLADGSQTLILMSDNNFNAEGGQFTQFLAFKLSVP